MPMLDPMSIRIQPSKSGSISLSKSGSTIDGFTRSLLDPDPDFDSDYCLRV